MSDTTKCPKCGAEEVAATNDRTLIRFLCHSMLKDGKPYSQSKQCEFGELRAKLEKAKEWLRHSDICFATKGHWDQNNQWVDGPCICGLSEFLATLE
jgi:hypothetical protein